MIASEADRRGEYVNPVALAVGTCHGPQPRRCAESAQARWEQDDARAEIEARKRGEPLAFVGELEDPATRSGPAMTATRRAIEKASASGSPRRSLRSARRIGEGPADAAAAAARGGGDDDHPGPGPGKLRRPARRASGPSHRGRGGPPEQHRQQHPGQRRGPRHDRPSRSTAEGTADMDIKSGQAESTRRRCRWTPGLPRWPRRRRVSRPRPSRAAYSRTSAVSTSRPRRRRRCTPGWRPTPTGGAGTQPA